MLEAGKRLQDVVEEIKARMVEVEPETPTDPFFLDPWEQD